MLKVDVTLFTISFILPMEFLLAIVKKLLVFLRFDVTILLNFYMLFKLSCYLLYSFYDFDFNYVFNVLNEHKNFKHKLDTLFTLFSMFLKSVLFEHLFKYINLLT